MFREYQRPERHLRMESPLPRLSGVTLPEDSRYLRNLPTGPGTDTDDFRAAYDRRTLFYDAFHEPETGLIRLIGPAFKRRLTIFLKRAVIKVDGARAEFDIRAISPRTGMVELKSPVEAPKKLRIVHRGRPFFSETIAVNPSETDRFAGRNALVAISKNNKLSWIRDWLSYYVEVHGANAVVLFDNGSDAYRFRAVRRTVLETPGIEEAAVISAPYPFGPRGADRMVINSKFFHLSMLHIAHLRYLEKANAVLSVDIDELVTKPGGRSVFEAVKDTPKRFMSIPGEWRYAMAPADGGAAGEAAEIRHRDHAFRRKGADADMSPKWCSDPQGPLQGHYWRLHGIAGTERYHDHDYRFLHCRQISTSWDYNRAFEPPELFEPAPEAAELAAAYDRADARGAAGDAKAGDSKAGEAKPGGAKAAKAAKAKPAKTKSDGAKTGEAAE